MIVSEGVLRGQSLHHIYIGNKTPYDLVKARFGKRFLDLINIVRVPNKKVKLVRIV